jgi:hypothetical protein
MSHYAITTEQIKTLANSNAVEVKVYGYNASIVRAFNNEHINSIKAYYEKFILKNGIKYFK